MSDSSSDSSLGSKSEVIVKSKSSNKPPLPEESIKFADTRQAIGSPSIHLTDGDFSNSDLEFIISSTGILIIKAESGR